MQHLTVGWGAIREQKSAHNKTGERVIVDPVLTTSRIYMYSYLLTNVGGLVGQFSVTYSEKYVGFWLAFTLPTLFFLLCPAILFLGRKRFAMRDHRNIIPVQIYHQLTAPDYWENAKPIRQGEKARMDDVR